MEVKQANNSLPIAFGHHKRQNARLNVGIVQSMMTADGENLEGPKEKTTHLTVACVYLS